MVSCGFTATSRPRRGAPERCAELLFLKKGREATAALYRGGDPPTALIAANQRMLSGVLDELDARGLALGVNVSMVVWCGRYGFGDFLADTRWEGLDFDRMVSLPEEMGRVAARILSVRAKDPAHPPIRVAMPMQFVACGTSCPPRPRE